MGNIVQLKYDELAAIGKQFNTEGDDYAELYSSTRQKVQALTKEWIGLGADKFFDEMEHDLLPALQRVSKALFFSEEVLGKITKLVHEADEDNASFFKGSLGGGDDFGAAGFQSALGGAQGGGGAGGSAGDDFGAAGFESALGGGQGSGGGGGASDLTESPANRLHSITSDFTEGGDLPNKKEMAEIKAEAKAQQEQTPQSSGGGGGGGGGSSQGLQGDLKNMGVGLVDQTPQTSSVGSGAPQDLPDHLFGGGDSGGGETPQPPAPAGGGAGGAEPATGGEGGLAAGVAGVAGSAAVGAAAKVVKDAKDEDS